METSQLTMNLGLAVEGVEIENFLYSRFFLKETTKQQNQFPDKFDNLIGSRKNVFQKIFPCRLLSFLKPDTDVLVANNIYFFTVSDRDRMKVVFSPNRYFLVFTIACRIFFSILQH